MAKTTFIAEGLRQLEDCFHEHIQEHLKISLNSHYNPPVKAGGPKPPKYNLRVVIYTFNKLTIRWSGFNVDQGVKKVLDSYRNHKAMIERGM